MKLILFFLCFLLVQSNLFAASYGDQFVYDADSNKKFRSIDLLPRIGIGPATRPVINAPDYGSINNLRLQTRDLAGTDGSTTGTRILVLNADKLASCVDNTVYSSNSGATNTALEDGILFISSEDYRQHVQTQSNLNRRSYQFIAANSYEKDVIVHNTELPLSDNYSYGSKIYILYYHTYRPIRYDIKATSIVDNVQNPKEESVTSELLGCWYLGARDSSNRVWVSLHTTTIRKDLFFQIIPVYQNDANKPQYGTYNSLLIRQGKHFDYSGSLGSFYK